MSKSYQAFCSDAHVNLRLNLKLDLPTGRETLLGFFDSLRKDFPALRTLRTYRGERAIESDLHEGKQQWVGVRRKSVRAGYLNPEQLTDAYAMHAKVLDVAPYFLSISPIEIDYIELMYGFDLQAGGNHDGIVFDALVSGSPLASLMNIKQAIPMGFMPCVQIALDEAGTVQAQFEVKTRTVRSGQPEPEPVDGEPNDAPGGPITVMLALRMFGAKNDLKELPKTLETLARVGEELVQHRVVPHMLKPIHQVITSHNL